MSRNDNSSFDPVSVDEAFRMEGFSFIAGVDESGRGPLAGPVLAAAVILPEETDLPLFLDCKKFSSKKREVLYDSILRQALAWHVACVGHSVIDEANILQASIRAMTKAVDGLDPLPDLILVDGPHPPPVPGKVHCLKGGDRLSQSIGAASILAKVERDRIMDEYHERYPQYGFSTNRGYGTKKHREAISLNGPCPIHRKTFRGVREYCIGPRPHDP